MNVQELTAQQLEQYQRTGVPAHAQLEIDQEPGQPITAARLIYTSPDGGHTVYTEVANKRVFVSEDPHARHRRRLGYLQQAITLADRDPRIMEYLEDRMHEVLTYAVLCGHEVRDWSEQP
jgi:hypothetical protein